MIVCVGEDILYTNTYVCLDFFLKLPRTLGAVLLLDSASTDSIYHRRGHFLTRLRHH